MSEFSEILEEKFLTKDVDQCVQVALRCALRNFVPIDITAPVEHSQLYILPLARLLLTCGLAYVFPVKATKDQMALALQAFKTPDLPLEDSAAFLAAEALSGSSASNARIAVIASTYSFASEVGDMIEIGPDWNEPADQVEQYEKTLDLTTMLAVRDFNFLSRKAFDAPLWHEESNPLTSFRPTVSALQFQHDANFSFWREWYQGFLDGKPMDWELQRRVAMIPDEDWEQGPEHIARVIEEIRKDFDGAAAPTQERFEELEPASLERILRAPTLSVGQIEAAAQGIRDAECRYLNESGANQLPDPFQALPEIAGSMLRVSQQIRQHASDPTVEDSLRQEIGRLNARVIELEQEVEALRKAPAPVFLPALKEQIGKSLGDWKMYGAMCGALWLISGDDLGMQQRLENLDAARTAIFGTEATTSDVLPDETPEVIEI